MFGMRRRQVITLLGVVAASMAWPLAARAQQPTTLRVGFVGVQPRDSAIYNNFRRRMAELGYQEGRNFTFDYIQTPNLEGYEKNYRELAARKVDVFLAVGNERALRAALSAADGRPIVFLAVDFDPLAKGYVSNLSRPGGNVTGIFVRQLELAAKRVEIAREAFPRATVLGIAYDAISREQRDAAAEAARKLGLEPRMIEVKGDEGYGGAFGAMEDARGQPIILPAGPMFFRDRAAIAQALLERRIPSIAAFRENAEAGALVSYGFDLKGLFYDIAGYVHRIAGGRQAVRHADRAIAALLHDRQSQGGGGARGFLVGCVCGPRQRGDRMKRRAASSLPGLTRQSILLHKKMDARVKPAHDGSSMGDAAIGRRELVFVLAGAAAAYASWPLAARAQQPPMPVIGYLSARSREDTSHLIAAFQRGLAESDYIDGRNVTIQYSFRAWRIR
jgi:putative tryptophan/tyrosine transport system substrate-binding protein